MKHLIIISLIVSLFSLSAFAEGETETECPMMREMNKRVNTKLNLSKDVKKSGQVSGSKATGE